MYRVWLDGSILTALYLRVFHGFGCALIGRCNLSAMVPRFSIAIEFVRVAYEFPVSSDSLIHAVTG